MRVDFQAAYDICASRADLVRLSRVQIDLCVPPRSLR